MICSPTSGRATTSTLRSMSIADRCIDRAARRRFVPLASGFADDDEALPIRAEARVLGATLKAGDTAEYELGAERHGYLVPALGSVEVNGVRIGARDGAAITDENVLKIKALEDTEIVLVDAA